MTGFGNARIQEYRNQRQIGGLCKVTVLLGSLLLTLSLYAQTSNLPAPGSNGEINNSAQLKLPVAHAHFASWCMGFLTIAPDEIRYDAVRSHGKDEHSFSLKREQVLFLNYWVLAGQPMNAVEIRTATKNYHFWLMQSAGELQRTDAGWRPVEAAASDSLLLSLYYWRVTGTVPSFAAVNAALAQAKLQAAASASAAQAGAPGNGAPSDLYERLNQHMFVNSYTDSATVNTINSINRMSHW